MAIPNVAPTEKRMIRGTKILILTNRKEYFRAFLQLQGPHVAGACFLLTSHLDLEQHPRAEVICLGEFWMHPDFPFIYNTLKDKCSVPGQELIQLTFFPMPKAV